MAKKIYATSKSWDASVLRTDIVTLTSVVPESVDYDERTVVVVGGFTAQQFIDIEDDIINV